MSLSGGAVREPTLLVLAALAGRCQHGYTLIDEVENLSEGRIRLRTGTVYAILERLREAGLIEVDREEIVASRLRRYFRLTQAGVGVLTRECEALRRQADVVNRRLQPGAPAPRPTPP
jgi:DNA-binding PadR family transcriptional regulator